MSGLAGLKSSVSTTGGIRTRGRLKAGHCTVSGTDTDPGHARGKWSAGWPEGSPPRCS